MEQPPLTSRRPTPIFCRAKKDQPLASMRVLRVLSPFFRFAFLPFEHRQVCPANNRLRMPSSHSALEDPQGAAQQRLRFGESIFFAIKHCQVAECHRRIGMGRAQKFFFDGQRALIERFDFGGPAGRLAKRGEIVEVHEERSPCVAARRRGFGHTRTVGSMPVMGSLRDLHYGSPPPQHETQFRGRASD
jgi:hypothetical protein